MALAPDFGRREVWWKWAWSTITIARFWALDIYTLTQSNRKKGGGGQGYTRKSWDRVGKRERQAGRAHLRQAGDSGEDEG